MNWLIGPLQEFFEWAFKSLEYLGWTPSVLIILLLIFGLAYWTFYWQPKYNKEAEANSDQLL